MAFLVSAVIAALSLIFVVSEIRKPSSYANFWSRSRNFKSIFPSDNGPFEEVVGILVCTKGTSKIAADLIFLRREVVSISENFLRREVVNENSGVIRYTPLYAKEPLSTWGPFSTSMAMSLGTASESTARDLLKKGYARRVLAPELEVLTQINARPQSNNPSRRIVGLSSSSSSQAMGNRVNDNTTVSFNLANGNYVSFRTSPISSPADLGLISREIRVALPYPTAPSQTPSQPTTSPVKPPTREDLLLNNELDD